MSHNREKYFNKIKHMKPDISVIIPNYNCRDTLFSCLNSIVSSGGVHFEVIVVDDGSDDDSLRVIKQFPCTVIRQSHQGASAARNAGARASRGKILFFTDADCVLAEDTLARALSSINEHDDQTIIGGSYDAKSYDHSFYSRFQAAFIHYSETKHTNNPDYIATHAMVINREVFLANGGFKEQWLPIIEDVEFSHRLRRGGYSLVMDPDLLVQHIFNFSLFKSVRNAVRKASYWTLYSMGNKDLLKDSGTASHELKFNVAFFYLMLMFLSLTVLTHNPIFLIPALLSISLNLCCNQRLLQHFNRHYSHGFQFGASLYYLFVYPVPVSLGGLIGVSKFMRLSLVRRTR